MSHTPEKSDSQNLTNQNPAESEPEKSRYRHISDDELAKVLAEQKKRIDLGHIGGKPVDLSKINLSKANLQNALLFNTNLQDAKLFEANLEGASMLHANLHDADLTAANLKNSILVAANLQDADLSETNLQGVLFDEANLQYTHIHFAKLRGTNLFKADLKYAEFFDATLINCDFEGADLYRADFGYAKMICCNFKGCNLKDVRRLDSTKLAQADITNTRLNDTVSEFKALNVVEEASRDARKIFLAVLLGCVYCWLTIGSTTDVALLTNSSSSNLPIIQTGVPIGAFYLAAPFLLAVLYIYLHLYLRRLWQALAGLPAIFEDGKPLDERAYPWMLNGMVRRHFIRLKGKYKKIERQENEDGLKWHARKSWQWLWQRIKGTRAFTARLEEWVSIFLAWWVVPITLGWFWVRYLTRHDWTGTIIQIIVLLITIFAGIIFYRVHAKTLAGAMFDKIQALGYFKWIAFALIAFFLIISSDGGIEDHNWAVYIQNKIGYDISANFREQDVSIKPDNYWLIDSTERDIAVKGAYLARADLRNADLLRAFLVNADFRWANLAGAVLIGANLSRANFHMVDFEGANLIFASLTDANMFSANFTGADLFLADLKNADLGGANMEYSRGLTQDQLDQAFGDSATTLPPGLTIPIKK